MAKHTPLYDEHVKLGGRMVDFADWEMPVQYTGVIDEHKAVRSAAGLFDVSHMGQIEICGKDAEAYVQYLTTNDAKKIIDGKAQYSILCNERGTVVDDVIVYRFTNERYILVVNASNVEKDFNWIKEHERGEIEINDISDSYALIAFQGPKSISILQEFTDIDLDSIETYNFREGMLADKANCIIAKTGYTGEEGVEIFSQPADAPAIWQTLLERGMPQGVRPAGLGARDTLRLEMKYSLYGHEIDDETTPLEAGLSWVVKLDTTDDFIGKQALIEFKEKGATRKLVGFKMIDKGIPRQGYPIITNDKANGIVTSGTMSPSLGEAIGIGFVPKDNGKIGMEFSIDIRGRSRKAEVVKTPFYKLK
ncbi:MAG: glycine cleavage system aminomethyltransferase GcvT [Deltaproteobacteria bacterium]|jgi:aminomethyltransferase|nr:glycine cleavage system aminomethyltransferase GcvT [Deltaproteobacteria bacterium]